MKGHTNNPNGRPKGTPNKVTTEIRERFTALVEDNLDQLNEDLKELDPPQRVKAILDLAKFVIPVMKAQVFKDVTEGPPKTIEVRFVEPDENLLP